MPPGAGDRAAGGDALLFGRATRSLVTRSLDPPGRLVLPDPTLDVLADRGRAMVVRLAHGLSDEDVAGRLSLWPLTGMTHAARAMSRLGTGTRDHLVVLAHPGPG